MSRGKKTFLKPEDQDRNARRNAKPPRRFPEQRTTAALKANHSIKKPPGAVDQAKELRTPLGSTKVRMLSKAEILCRTGRTYPTIWRWMRERRFPRARDFNGHPAWLEAEIDEFFAGLPIRKLKGE